MDKATEQRAKMSGIVPTRDQILTQGDLVEFKEDMLQEFKRIIRECLNGQPGKKWLKSAEVKKLLGISHGFFAITAGQRCAALYQNWRLHLLRLRRHHLYDVRQQKRVNRERQPAGRFFGFKRPATYLKHHDAVKTKSEACSSKARRPCSITKNNPDGIRYRNATPSASGGDLF